MCYLYKRIDEIRVSKNGIRPYNPRYAYFIKEIHFYQPNYDKIVREPVQV